MKRMKTLKASALTVLFGMAVLCTVMFAACPNAAKGGGKSGPAYVKVPYDKLDGYLAKTASADKVNYIEVTGVSKEDLAGKAEGGNTEAGALGKKILAAAPKKVALKLPGKVEGLDSMSLCFAGCTNLVSLVNIPSSVTNMESCFNGCTSLTEAPVIPANVTDMYYCFEDCTSLTKAPVIPANVTNINGCFYDCTSLTKAPDIPANVTDMRSCFANCTSLTKAPVIPANVTTMAYCFSSCTSLTKAPDIPEGVTNMRGCFEDCTSLTESPVIPASVTNINDCFNGCTSLTKAPVIPASVEYMGWCFAGCSALKGVQLLCNYDGTGDRFEDVFNGCTALEAGGIKVKNEHYGDYTAAAALYKMAVPPIGNTAEQKKKFSKF